jgi:hypothetical protein
MTTTTENYQPFGVNPNYNYTSKEVAEIRRCEPCTLEAERSRGSGPPFIKSGRLVLYPGHLLLEWMEGRVVTNTQRFGRREVPYERP